MTNVLSRKLELFGPLPDEDRRLLDAATSNPRSFSAGTVIVHRGARPNEVQLVAQGIAFRSKTLENGQRQIFAFLLPGDLCDSHVFVLDDMDYDIVALTDCRVVAVAREQIISFMERPAIARAIWFSTMVDEATLREWLVNLGQRDAEERTAHLFCELHMRMVAVGLATETNFDFPLTQTDLGDTMGISTVHTNRVLQSLRSRDLVDLKGGQVVIPDIRRLREFASFDASYLHLGTSSQARH